MFYTEIDSIRNLRTLNLTEYLTRTETKTFKKFKQNSILLNIVKVCRNLQNYKLESLFLKANVQT